MPHRLKYLQNKKKNRTAIFNSLVWPQNKLYIGFATMAPLATAKYTVNSHTNDPAGRVLAGVERAKNGGKYPTSSS